MYHFSALVVDTMLLSTQSLSIPHCHCRNCCCQCHWCHCCQNLILLLLYADIEMTCCCCLWKRGQGKRIHSERMQGKDDNAKTKQANKQTKHQNDIADAVFPKSVVSIATKQCFFADGVDMTHLSPPLLLSIQHFHFVIVKLLSLWSLSLSSVLSPSHCVYFLLLLLTSVLSVGLFMTLKWPVHVSSRKKDKEKEYTVRECKAKTTTQIETNIQAKHQNDAADCGHCICSVAWVLHVMFHKMQQNILMP